MTTATEYVASIRSLDQAAKRAVKAAEAVQSDDLQSLKLTAHFIACVADNLQPDEARQ